MWHRHGYGCRQIDNHLFLRSGFPDIDDSVADGFRKVDFCAGEAFRRIFKLKFSFRHFLCIFIHQFCAADSDIDNFLAVFFEDLFPLCQRSGIVQMYNGFFGTFQRFKCFCDDMFSGLCQHLYGNIVRNHILFNQCTQKFILCFRCGGKANLDFLEAKGNQETKELYFFI